MSIDSDKPLIIGRYAIYDAIASGGMGTVHLARLMGPAGFSRTVAAKRLQPNLTSDPDFAAMLIDEARVAGRIRHPNVVSTLDVVATKTDLLLVMEYIHGESLFRLSQAVEARGERIPLGIVGTALIDALHGLHAAHEATDPQGRPLEVVHRDISPQNLMVGIDGITRVADFGIAKARGRWHVTGDLSLKGKLAYMAPEQIELGEVSRATDVFAASIVLWELLTGRQLFAGRTDGQTVHNVMKAQIVPAGELVPGVPPQIDAILRRGLARDPLDRYPTALDMATDLEACIEHVRAPEIGAWVQEVARESLAERAELLREIEAKDPPIEHATTDPVLFLRQGSNPPQTRRVNKSGPPPAPTPSSPPEAAPSSPSDEGARYGTSRMKTIHTLDGEPAPTKRRRWVAPSAVVALSLAAAAIVVVRQRHNGFEPTRAQGTGPADLQAPSAPHVERAPIPVEALPQAAPESVATPGTPPTELVRAAADAGSTAPTSKSRAAAPKSPGGASHPPPAPAHKPQADCDPPYTVDSAGRRIFKVECM